MGIPNGTDHGLRDRRDEKLHRAVRAIESGRAVTVVASDTGRKRKLSQCRTNLGPRMASRRRGDLKDSAAEFVAATASRLAARMKQCYFGCG